MGFMQNGRTIAAAQTAKSTKQMAQAQATAHQAEMAREAKLLEHIAYQSKVLGEIRDLLKAQQGS